MTLRKVLALHGRESNDVYDFPLRCLFNAPQEHLRCLNLTGAQGRRKTAFAYALGLALDYPHRLYHDFSAAEPPPPPIVLSGETTEATESREAPRSAFERAVTEACAYSEGARTILVLDQLQAADFREHIRPYHFVASREWSTGQGTVVAQAKTLLLRRNSWPRGTLCSTRGAPRPRRANTGTSWPTCTARCARWNNCANACTAGPRGWIARPCMRARANPCWRPPSMRWTAIPASRRSSSAANERSRRRFANFPHCGLRRIRPGSVDCAAPTPCRSLLGDGS